MYKIGFCGAHGTGKTTLAQAVANKYNLPVIDRTMRNAWEKMGVSDFEKLPKDIRTVAQQHLILAQIAREDEFADSGFAADRTMIDLLAYTLLDSTMSGSALLLFRQLVKERLKNYSLIVYCPIEFEVESEYLRANIDTRHNLNQVILEIIEDLIIDKTKLIRVSGSVEERLLQLSNHIQHD